MEVLKAKKIDKRVKAEFIAKRFPEDYGWGVLAGIEEAVYLLKDLPVNVRAIDKGSNRCSCGGRFQELLLPLIQNKRVLQDLPTPQVIRKYVLQQLPRFDL
jgi:hypothetical protein